MTARSINQQNAMSNNSNKSGGIGFTGLLQITFIILKLCGVIAWSWWWVLSPIWIGAAIILVVIALVLISSSIAEISRPKRGRW